MPKSKSKAKAKQDAKPLELERVVENVKHNFTDDELIIFGYSLGQKYRAIRAVQNDKKATAADYTAREKTLESEIDEISGKINAGFEMRGKECFCFRDFKKMKLYLFLCDDLGDPKKYDCADADELLDYLLNKGPDPVFWRKLEEYERQAALFDEQGQADTTEGKDEGGPDEVVTD